MGSDLLKQITLTRFFPADYTKRSVILVTDPSAATVTPLAGLPVVPEVPPWCALEASHESVRAAREHARDFLGGTASDFADDVVTVVSELVTNAIVHAPEGHALPPGISPLILLSVQAEARWILIAVRDPWPGAPSVRTPGEFDERGRGLVIIDQLTAGRWHTEHEHGKTVYALLLRPGCALTPGELDRLGRS